jgi:cell division protein ZipA
VFDMATIETFSTPGISLFLRVHELSEPLQSFESMLGVAESIAHELTGEVCDETRSVMTPQTVEHCRQSIREFQYKHSA